MEQLQKQDRRLDFLLQINLADVALFNSQGLLLSSAVDLCFS